MNVVDVADEFGLTTAEAVDACMWAGVPVTSPTTTLTPDDARHVRDLLSRWIEAGFAPWRGDDVPDEDAPSRAGEALPAGTDDEGTDATHENGSAKRLEPARTGRSRLRPRGPAGSDVPARGRSSVEVYAPMGPTARGTGGGPGTLGSMLTASRGGPTGWLPGGPKAHPRLAPLAIAALVLAVSSLIIPFVTAVLALVLATVAKDKIQGSRGWLRGERLATAAQIVAGIGVTLWLVLLASQVLFYRNRDNEPDYLDIQVDVATIRYEDIHLGDCVRLPRVGEITGWRTVDCDQGHRGEVFAALSIGNAIGLGYPGDQPIQATATADCRKKLADYLADASELDALETGFAYPSRATWSDDGERTVWCVLFRKDGTLLGKSMKKQASG